MSLSQATPSTSATDSLLSASEISIDRLPKLQSVFDDVCTLAETGFTELSDASLKLALENLSMNNLADLRTEVEAHLVTCYKTQDEPRAYITLDRDAVYVLLECMLGAARGEPAFSEQRDFTPLETLFAKTVADRFSTAVCETFREFTFIEMTSLSVDQGIKVDEDELPDQFFFVAKLTLEALGRSGKISLILPREILAQAKSCLAMPVEEKTHNPDPQWVAHIESELQQSEVSCQAVLMGGEITLDEVANLSVGQILKLNVAHDSLVKLRTDGQDLFWCELGQANGVFNVKVAQPIVEETDFLDAILNSCNSRSPNMPTSDRTLK